MKKVIFMLLLCVIGTQAQAQFKPQKKSTAAINQEIEDVEKIRQGFEKILAVNQKVNRELGFIPQVAEGIDKALSKLGLPELGFAEALQETKRLAQEADSLGLKFSTFGTYIYVFTTCCM